MLVDKDINKTKFVQNKNKSVFSIGDYRHNLPYKEETEFFGSQVQQIPKQFFSWDNNTIFNPKLKKDKSVQ
jgi:hypothetical protein